MKFIYIQVYSPYLCNHYHIMQELRASSAGKWFMQLSGSNGYNLNEVDDKMDEIFPQEVNQSHIIYIYIYITTHIMNIN